MLTRLLKKQGCRPKRMVTDKLRSYGAAKRTVMPDVEHRSHKGLNNRAESSHVPIRKRERMMQDFRSWSGLQRFVRVFSAVRNLFVPTRSDRSAFAIHFHRLNTLVDWHSAAAMCAYIVLDVEDAKTNPDSKKVAVTTPANSVILKFISEPFPARTCYTASAKAAGSSRPPARAVSTR